MAPFLDTDAVAKDLQCEARKLAGETFTIDISQDLLRNEFCVWASCSKCRARFGERETVPHAVGPLALLTRDVVDELRPPATRPMFTLDVPGRAGKVESIERETQRRNRIKWVATSIVRRLGAAACDCIAEFQEKRVT